MRNLFATAAAVAGLLVAGAASAATVDITLTQAALGSATWALNVDDHSSTTALGAINMFVTGLNAFTPNPLNTGISVPDTTLQIDPLSDGLHNFLVVNNVAGQAIVGAGAIGTLIGTLTGPVCTGTAACLALVTAQGAEALAGSPTLFDTAGNPSTLDFAFHVDPVAPEPASVVLLGLALGGLGLIRRRA